jgi:ABC-2 type transport system permease protein
MDEARPARPVAPDLRGGPQRRKGPVFGGPLLHRVHHPWVLAQSVLFVAIFYGINIVWEKDVGVLTKLLSTPAPYSSIIVGKALSAGIRGVFQAFMVFALALVISVNVRLDPFDVAGVFIVIVVFAMCFSSLSMLLASFLKTRDRMMGISQLITMPLFFASNAIYPISIMPKWLQYVSMVNPVSYSVDAMRSMLLTGDYSNPGIDILAISFSTVLFVSLASLAIKRMLE